MAKRKGTEPATAESSIPTGPLPEINDGPVDCVPLDFVLHELGRLSGEVQSFLGMRAELARKLALEIETTEKRLVELKRAAALLFPAECSCQCEKERQERKLKKAPVGRTGKTDREAGDDKQLRIEAMELDPVAPEIVHHTPHVSHAAPAAGVVHEPVRQQPHAVAAAPFSHFPKTHYSIDPPHPPRFRLSVPRRTPAVKRAVARSGAAPTTPRHHRGPSIRRSVAQHVQRPLVESHV